MTFTAGEPADGESLGHSKPLIRNNLDGLRDTIAINHVDINDVGNGKHKYVQMPDQGSAPTTAANESALYGKAVSGASQLFFRKESNGTEIQMTGVDPTDAQQGKTFLPGGLILIWDRVNTVTSSGSTTVTFPFGGFPTNCFNIQCTIITNDNSSIRFSIDESTPISNTGFKTTQTNSSHFTGLFYLAIGN